MQDADKYTYLSLTATQHASSLGAYALGGGRALLDHCSRALFIGLRGRLLGLHDGLAILDDHSHHHLLKNTNCFSPACVLLVDGGGVDAVGKNVDNIVNGQK